MCESWSRLGLSPCVLVLTGSEAKVFGAEPEMHWAKIERNGEAGGMVQRLRVLTAVSEDPGSVSSTFMVAHKHQLTPVPGPPTSFSAPWAPGVHVVHT